jgi:hypothetical protein
VRDSGIEELERELSALEERVTAAEAVLAVHALKADYGDLVDRRFSHGTVADPATLDRVVAEIVELFTLDAVWDGGPALGIATGREAIAERLLAPTLVFSRHLFTKPRILVEGTRGSGRWDLLCPCRTPDGRSWWMCGYEDDEYRLEDGRWRHSRMRLTTVFMAETGDGFERILA